MIKYINFLIFYLETSGSGDMKNLIERKICMFKKSRVSIYWQKGFYEFFGAPNLRKYTPSPQKIFTNLTGTAMKSYGK